MSEAEAAPAATAAPELVQRALDALLASEQLGKSDTSRRLLAYLVERALRHDAPKETEIALDVFGKSPSFNGSDDSVVRVSVRTLRQKLAEYYAGPGRKDAVRFEIPKGGYRVMFIEKADVPADAFKPGAGADVSVSVAGAGVAAVGGAPAIAASTALENISSAAQVRESAAAKPAARWPRAARWLTAAALAVLVVSVITNVYQWNSSRASVSPQLSQVRNSPVWSDVTSSHRPLTIVLGDLFMYTQTDPVTGRTLTVRDTGINSSEELRAFLASNPSYAAERGLRYVTMVQKSAAIGIASILPLVNEPGRNIEVTVRDDVREEAIRRNDVIYIGPLARTGPLAGYYQLRSRYRYNAADSTVTDTVTGKVLAPSGDLGSQHTDYALVAKFNGPDGNHILIFTSGARNAGLLQIVRTMTSPEGLAGLETKLRAQSGGRLDEFEALLTVTGFKTTDLAAEVVEVHSLAAAGASAASSTPQPPGD